MVEKSSDGSGGKFYTKQSIADWCIEQVSDIESYPFIVEPSAGSGVFLKGLPEHTEAYDIDPAHDSVVKKSWFDVAKLYHGGLLIGNPPFGKRSSLARGFIERGIALGFDTIAFILPKTFKKHSMQKVFGSEWSLVLSKDLPNDSFSYNGSDYHVPSVFMIWERHTDKPDLRAVKYENPGSFDFLPRGDASADFCIIGTSGRVVSLSEVSNPKGTHYIRAKKDVERLKEEMSAIIYEMNSSVSGGAAWLSQNDIIGGYIKYTGSLESS